MWCCQSLTYCLLLLFLQPVFCLLSFILYCFSFNLTMSHTPTNILNFGGPDRSAEPPKKGESHDMDIPNSDGMEAGVYGNWFVFEPTELVGEFTKKCIVRKRIKLDPLVPYTLVHNTNLHSTFQGHSRHGRGTMLVHKPEHSTCYKLYLILGYNGKSKCSLLEWKGAIGDNKLPAFLTVTTDQYVREFKSHFQLLDLPKIPNDCFFVNVFFHEDAPANHEIHARGRFPGMNEHDGCVQQSTEGPCKLFLPTLAYRQSDSSHSWPVLATDNSYIRRRKRSKTHRVYGGRHYAPFQRVRMNPKTDPDYDVIFFQAYNSPRHVHKSTTLSDPRPLKHLSEQHDLPPQWSFHTNFNNSFKTKLPDEIDESKFTEVLSSKCLSSFPQLIHEGDRLRVLLIPTKFQWTELKTIPILREQKHVCYGMGYEAIIGISSQPPVLLPGVLVSNWGPLCPETIKIARSMVDYKVCSMVEELLGKGFGGRLRADSEGVNNYYGWRSNDRAHMTGAVGKKETKNQRYFRQEWAAGGDEFKRAYLEKVAIDLPVEDSMKQLSFNYSEFIGYTICDKNIWTSGNRNHFSFFNESHSDGNDMVDSSKEHVFDTKLTTNFKDLAFPVWVDDYIRRIRKFCGGYPMPTTCSYLHLWEDDIVDPRVKVWQDFCYSEFAFSKKINNHLAHNMLPCAFIHNTGRCVLMKDGKIYTKPNSNIANFTLMAWGRSGGKAESRRNVN